MKSTNEWIEYIQGELDCSQAQAQSILKIAQDAASAGLGFHPEKIVAAYSKLRTSRPDLIDAFFDVDAALDDTVEEEAETAVDIDALQLSEDHDVRASLRFLETQLKSIERHLLAANLLRDAAIDAHALLKSITTIPGMNQYLHDRAHSVRVALQTAIAAYADPSKL